MRIKKGDKVVVITGASKGQTGIVLKALVKDEKVLVQGINMVKKHRKPSQANPEGAIIEKEAPVHISNVQIVDPKTNKPTKVGYIFEDGKKIRVTKGRNASGAKLDK